MPNNPDNNLGAPTEGLGQNVTFSFRPQSGPPQMSGGQAQMLRATASGGQQHATTSAQGVQAAPSMDPTVELLFKVGDKIMRPHMEKLRTERFVQGMQRAMEGEAIVDIAAQQPWYSKVFGDSDVVEGARQYLGNTRAQEAVAAMEDDMPELRKMDPEAARNFFTQSVTKNLTGDKAADAAILQAMTRALPSVMRRQAKEHYGWKQEQASTAESASFRSGAASLQAKGKALADGYTTPEDFGTDAMAWIRSTMPAAGRDLENWQKRTAADLIGAAEAGQLHAVNAWRTPMKDGVSGLDSLTAEQRNKVESAVNSAESRLRTRYSFDWNDQLTDLETRAARPPVGTTPDQLLTQVDAINARYQKETGSSLGLISPAERTAIGKGSALAIAHAKDQEWARREANNKAADTAAAKAQAENDKRNAVEQAAAKGDLYLMASTPGYSNDYIDSTLVPTYRTLDPQQRASLLVRNFVKGGYVIKPIAAERDGYVTQAVSQGQGQYDAGAEAVYQDWKVLNSINPDIAAAYYPKNGPRLAKFDRAVTNGVPVAQAFGAAFVNDLGRTKADAKVLKAAVNEVTSDYNSWMPGMLGGRKLRPEAANVVANYIGDAAEVWTDVLSDPKAGAKRALELAKSSNRVEMLGGHAWVNTPNAAPLASYLTKTGASGQVALGTDTLDDVVEQAVEQLLDTHKEIDKDNNVREVPGVLPGVKAQTITVTRLPDLNGVPQLHVMALHDGKSYDALLSADSMFALYERKKQSKQRAKERIGQPFVTEGGGFGSQQQHRPNLVGSDPRANAPK